MASAYLLPYITSLGTLFVLIGFSVLIWKEGASHTFSTLAFFSIIFGIAVSCGSIYADRNYDSIFIPSSVEGDEQSRTALATCEMQAKDVYLDSLRRSGIKCPADAKGWPKHDCVLQSDLGKKLYAQLTRDVNSCIQTQ